MKKFFTLVFLGIMAIPASALDFTLTPDGDLAPRNCIKTNLLSYAAFNVNANYEFKLSEKFSIGMVAGYVLPRSFDLALEATNTSDGDFQWQGQVTVTQGIILSPYGRMYTNEAMTGFYLELFTRFYNYQLDIPYDYEKDGIPRNESVIGSATAFGGGLALGSQIQLGKIFVLDLMFGVGAGMGNVHLETNDPNLDAQDYQDIKEEMEQIQDVEIAILQNTIDKITYDASNTQAWADAENILIPMIKGGISFGIMF